MARREENRQQESSPSFFRRFVRGITSRLARGFRSITSLFRSKKPDQETELAEETPEINLETAGRDKEQEPKIELDGKSNDIGLDGAQTTVSAQSAPSKENKKEKPGKQTSDSKNIPTPPPMPEFNTPSANPGRANLMEEIRRQKKEQPELNSEEKSTISQSSSSKEKEPKQPEQSAPNSNTIPTPPPMPEFNTPSANPGRANLLNEIRGQKRGVKLSKNHANPEGDIDFNYVDISAIQKKAAINEQGGLLGAFKQNINIDSEAANLLSGKTTQVQSDILYSALVDNNQELVDKLKNYQELRTSESIESSESSESIDNEWDGVEEKQNIFSKDDLSTITEAALETEQRLDRGEDLPKQNHEVVTNQQTVQVEAENIQTTVNEPDKKNTQEADSNPSINNTQQEENIPPIRNIEDIVGRADLNQAIINGKTLRSTPQANQTLNIGEFEYLNTSAGKTTAIENHPLKENLGNRRQGLSGDDFGDKFDNMESAEQKSTLYTALLDGDGNKVKSILEGESEHLDKNNLTKICEAARKTANRKDLTIANEKKFSKANETINKLATEEGLKLNTSNNSKNKGASKGFSR